jgi:hypothetical protein
MIVKQIELLMLFEGVTGVTEVRGVHLTSCNRSLGVDLSSLKPKLLYLLHPLILRRYVGCTDSTKPGPPAGPSPCRSTSFG